MPRSMILTLCLMALSSLVAGQSNYTCPAPGSELYANKTLMDEMNADVCSDPNATTTEYNARLGFVNPAGEEYCVKYCYSCEPGVCSLASSEAVCSDPTKCTLCTDPPGCQPVSGAASMMRGVISVVFLSGIAFGAALFQ